MGRSQLLAGSLWVFQAIEVILTALGALGVFGQDRHVPADRILVRSEVRWDTGRIDVRYHRLDGCVESFNNQGRNSGSFNHGWESECEIWMILLTPFSSRSRNLVAGETHRWNADRARRVCEIFASSDELFG